jgi:hypothetical protein
MKQANSGTFSIPPPPMLGAGSRNASASGGVSMNSMKGGNKGMAALKAQTPGQQGQSQTSTNWGSGGDSLI